MYIAVCRLRVSLFFELENKQTFSDVWDVDVLKF